MVTHALSETSKSNSLRTYIGSHGWSSVELNWMYQKGLEPTGKLGAYSQMFNAVEVGETFFGLDCLKSYKSWLSAVPEDFQFSLKVPRAITHERMLLNPEPILSEFLSAARNFGTYLGPILVQLPPWFGIKHANNLQTFLDQLPFEEMRFAIEVRDQRLWSETVPFLMEQYPFIPVTTNLIASPQDLRSLNDATYIRWLGSRKEFEGPLKTADQFYEESFQWSESIKSVITASTRPNVYVFIDHEYFGPGVIGAARLRKLLGTPVHFPGTFF